MPKKTLLSLFLASLLSACSLAPTYETPVFPTPQTWPQGDAYKPADLTRQGTPASAIDWKVIYQDPMLQQLIIDALQNNRDLRIATLQIQRAQAQYGIQQADLFPNINLSGQTARQRISDRSSPTGTGSVQTAHTLGLGFSAFEIDLFGRISNATDAAYQNYLATDAAARTVQIALIAQVASSYATLLANNELLNLAKETYRAQEESYNLNLRSYQAGIINQLVLSQAQTAVQAARFDVATYTTELAQSKNALQLLVGESQHLRFDNLPSLRNLKIVQEIPVGLPSDMLLYRPDIQQAEYQLIAANANIGVARARLFPSIQLTASVGRSTTITGSGASSELSELFSAGTGTWSFIPSINLPIFNAGAILRGIEVSKVEKEIAIAQYEKAIQVAFREVADTLANRGTILEQLEARRTFLKAASTSYNLSQARFKSGIDSYLNVLDSQRSYYAAQQALILTQLADINTSITLYKVLGGGLDASVPFIANQVYSTEALPLKTNGK